MNIALMDHPAACSAVQRFTSAVAQAKGGEAGLDARAAAELLQGWLDRQGNA